MAKSASEERRKLRTIDEWGALLMNDYFSILKREWRLAYGGHSSAKRLRNLPEHKIMERLYKAWRSTAVPQFSCARIPFQGPCNAQDRQVSTYLRRLEKRGVVRTDRNIRPHRYDLVVFSDARLDAIVTSMGELTAVQHQRLSGSPLPEVVVPIIRCQNSAWEPIIASDLAA